METIGCEFSWNDQIKPIDHISNVCSPLLVQCNFFFFSLFCRLSIVSLFAGFDGVLLIKPVRAYEIFAFALQSINDLLSVIRCFWNVRWMICQFQWFSLNTPHPRKILCFDIIVYKLCLMVHQPSTGKPINFRVSCFLIPLLLGRSRSLSLFAPFVTHPSSYRSSIIRVYFQNL